MGRIEVEDFLNGPLVTWFLSCLQPCDRESITYEDLVDGALVHSVFLQMDLPVVENEILPTGRNSAARSRNLHRILSNLRHYYEDESCAIILQTPNVANLAKEPRLHVKEAELLFSLLLGCAVTCPNNDSFIGGIQQLDEESQKCIASCITQVLHVPGIVISESMFVEDQDGVPSGHPTNIQKAFEHLRRINYERNFYREQLRSVTKEYFGDEASTLEIEDQIGVKVKAMLDRKSESLKEELGRCEAELNDCRSKLRHLVVELQEKQEDLCETREELELSKQEVFRMRSEIEVLAKENRRIKTYEDELDIFHETKMRADRLEQEIAKLKEKLADIDYYKTRVNELTAVNKLLMQSKDALVEELAEYKIRAEKVPTLEKNIKRLESQIGDLVAENSDVRRKYEEMADENAILETQVRTTMNESIRMVLDRSDSSSCIPDSILEQLANSTQSQALKMEFESHRTCSMDTSNDSFIPDSPSKMPESRKNRWYMSSTIEALKGDMRRLAQRNEQLEKSHMESSDSGARIAALEQSIAAMMVENNQLKGLLSSSQMRANEMELSLGEANKKIDELNAKLANPVDDRVHQELESESRINELEEQINRLRNERDTAVSLYEEESKLVDEKNQCLEASAAVIGRLEKLVEKLERQCNEESKESANLKELVQLLNDKTPISSPTGFPSQDQEWRRNRIKALIEYFEMRSRLYTEFKQMARERDSLKEQLRNSKNEIEQLNTSIASLKNTCSFLEEERRAGVMSSTLMPPEEHRRSPPRFMNSFEKLNDDYHCCADISKANSDLLVEKQKLMTFIQTLLDQNRTLVKQIIEAREDNHKQKMHNSETVNQLTRQKEKLEEKIMDYYKRVESCKPKKKTSTNLVKATFFKMRRAGSEMFNRSRNSWIEVNPVMPAPDFEFCRGSDLPQNQRTNQNRNRNPADVLKNFDPERFSFGGRNSILDPRSRQSVDFSSGDEMGNPLMEPRSRQSVDFLTFCNRNDDEDFYEELEETLHETSKEIADVFANKTVDLSSNGDERDKDSEEESKGRGSMASDEFDRPESRIGFYLDMHYPTSHAY
ncbi:hypothetical protein QAD02_006509 [Eretmocerus hayati]|uniref:Uncharacterized protein n=1 Tax=Eretmocerus hayati TaxID=131215 RepID=A0ACC2N166_9HYME|nr:hypothetical protein QAD02_006509 [Eretmocerus hayati]